MASTGLDQVISTRHLGPNLDRLLKAIPGFEAVAIGASRGLGGVLRSNTLGRTIADILHGTWLGHPLHAVLVEIPVGA